jgi:hypothetical protein
VQGEKEEDGREENSSMIPITTYLTADEATRAQEAADACDMSLGEFARWAVVLQSVAITNNDQETIDQPWGAPVDDSTQGKP